MTGDPHSEPLTPEQEQLLLKFYGEWKAWPASRPDDWPEDVERDKQRTEKLNADFMADLRSLVRDVVGPVEKERDEESCNAEAIAAMLDAEREKLSASEASAEELRRQRDEARRFGEQAAKQYNELLAERVLTCAFCGEEYPPGTPPTQHEALTAHVMVCAKHPMRAAEASAHRLTKALGEIRDLHTLRVGGGCITCNESRWPCTTELEARDALNAFVARAALDEAQKVKP